MASWLQQQWDKWSGIMELEMPLAETLEGTFDNILPTVRQHGVGLDTQKYVDVRYFEMRDDDDYHEAVLNIFKPNGEYITIVNGNISRGKWSLLNGGFIINQNGEGFYELVFLNDDLFVLKKHGSQANAKRKYLMFGKETLVKKNDWRAIMESLYNLHRSNVDFSTVIFWIALVAVILVLAIWV